MMRESFSLTASDLSVRENEKFQNHKSQRTFYNVQDEVFKVLMCPTGRGK